MAAPRVTGTAPAHARSAASGRTSWPTGWPATARYAAIAALAALPVAALAAVGWALRLSTLTRFVSDTILVGFKAGAGISVAVTQLPGAFRVAGGGDHFFERLGAHAPGAA